MCFSVNLLWYLAIYTRKVDSKSNILYYEMIKRTMQMMARMVTKSQATTTHLSVSWRAPSGHEVTGTGTATYEVVLGVAALTRLQTLPNSNRKHGQHTQLLSEHWKNRLKRYQQAVTDSKHGNLPCTGRSKENGHTKLWWFFKMTDHIKAYLTREQTV